MKLSPTVLSILFMGVLLVGAAAFSAVPAAGAVLQVTATSITTMPAATAASTGTAAAPTVGATQPAAAPTQAGTAQSSSHPTQGSGFLNLMQTFQPGNPQDAQGLVSNGKGDLPACQGCHGANGQGDPVRAIPRLAGLQAFYLYHQLLAFQDGTRKNNTMVGIATNLSSQQKHDVAAYYAALPTPNIQPAQASQDTLAAGQQVFEFGEKKGWDAWMPACYTCHGSQAQGVGAFIPPLAGQGATYMQNQLQAWKQGTRTDDPNGLMTTVAAQLSDQQVKDVALYLNNLNPGAQGTAGTQGI